MPDVEPNAQPPASSRPPAPGLYEIPELEYHRDEMIPGGTLSSTMAKIILRSPANLRHHLDSPRVERAEFDFGHAVHAEVLGVGLGVTVLDYPDWRTKAAREERDAIHATGGVPMLERDYVAVRAAVAAVRAHDVAGPLFSDGVAEQSMFAVDPETGLWLRGRVDWLTSAGDLVDLKTTVTGEPYAFERTGRRLGYDLQLAFYRHILTLIGRPPARQLIVTVERDAPHLVDVHSPPDWPEIGEIKRQQATALYLDCLNRNVWPGRPAVINEIASPDWALETEDIVI